MTGDILKFALRLLSRKDYFEHELRKKLEEKFGDTDEIDLVLNRLKELKYIDDDRVAQQFIKSQFKRGNGQYLIRKKLLDKGIDLPISTIESFKEIDDDFKELIVKKFQKYKGDYQKTVAYFYRKGYSYDLIKSVLSEVMRDEGDFC